jgi:hypothetical protein
MASRARKSTARRVRQTRFIKPSSRRPPACAFTDYFPSGDPLLRLSRAISLVETVEAAMRTRDDEPELGAICTSLEFACRQLGQAHEAIDLALQRTSKDRAQCRLETEGRKPLSKRLKVATPAMQEESVS